MLKLISKSTGRILKNKKQIEENLDVKISNRGSEFFIEGSGHNEYLAEKIINALEMGFPFLDAMLILEGYEFEIMNIKDYTTRKDLGTIRGRIIGKSGRTLKILSDLIECKFELKDNKVGIISKPELLRTANDAIISLIKGSKQANVYSKLEKNKPKPVLDLELKKEFKKFENQ